MRAALLCFFLMWSACDALKIRFQKACVTPLIVAVSLCCPVASTAASDKISAEAYFGSEKTSIESYFGSNSYKSSSGSSFGATPGFQKSTTGIQYYECT